MLNCLPVSIFGDICRGDMKVSEWASAARDMGLDGFDISVLFIRDRTPHGLAEFRRELEVSGLPCLVMDLYSDFTDLRPGMYEKELVRALSDIAVASDLGVRAVRITAGQFHPEFPEDAQLEQAIRGILECKPFADRVGVEMLWENHSKPGAWEHPDFNYDPVRLKKMAARLRGSGVYMNYDVANAYLIGLGPDYLKECLPEVRCIHLNDIASKTPLRFAGLLEGSVPIRENLEVLKEAGYRGIITVEEASFGGLDGIRKYVAEAGTLLKEYGLL